LLALLASLASLTLLASLASLTLLASLASLNLLHSSPDSPDWGYHESLLEIAKSAHPHHFYIAFRPARPTVAAWLSERML
jgi:hypothetical protein